MIYGKLAAINHKIIFHSISVEQKFLDLEDKMDTLDGKVKWLKNNDDAIKEWAKKTFALKGIHNA